MKVIFHTNLDQFQTENWPRIPRGIIPRKGDYVRVLNPEYYTSKGLPIYLEVTSVVYSNSDPYTNNALETVATCELWYTDSQLKLYDNKVLMGQ